MSSCLRRILMTTDTVGGVWSYALELSAGLAARGIEVVLAAMGRPDGAQRAAAAAVPGLLLRVGEFKLEWMDEPWADVEAAGRWLMELERTHAPEVVHLNGYAHGALPWTAPALVVAHSCVLSWWRAVKREEAPPSWRRYSDAVARGLRAAAVVVAPTAFMLDSVRRDYGPLRRALVIPNGRDARRFTAACRKRPAILSCGRLWDEAKNVATLARVAPALPWPVRVAGEAQHPEGGRARFEGVTWLGRLDEETLTGEYAAASIFALPARYEPFGLSPLEAALSGCALVLGDTPSLREVWGDAALFVPPDDERALAQAIGRLCAEPALLNELARRGLRRALRYTPDAMTAAYVDVYAALGAALEGRDACAS